MKFQPSQLEMALHEAVRTATYRETRLVPCCATRGIQWAAVVDGEWATGATLPNGYSPPPDELVRIHFWLCPGCGLQVS